MHKTKKVSKKPELPKPIKVKKEKSEEERALRSLTDYVDDRLELIRQVFGTLKPKTISNLTPAFMKDKELEEIEEKCLNELLCLSKKRLLSVMSNTKCPTDTDTTSDSDLEQQVEHISLEEISSDSDIATSSKAKAKKKTNKAAKEAPAKETEGKKEMSVLELLELQARARAIRSQLALEPVTKIELESDEETAQKKDNHGNVDKGKSALKKKKRSRNERQKSVEPKTADKMNDKHTNGKVIDSTTEKQIAVEQPVVPTVTKKVKIKRNFPSRITMPNTTVEASKTDQDTKVKIERKSRSRSPDVIPVIVQPIVVNISDSSDEEKAKGLNTDEVLQQSTLTVVKLTKKLPSEDGEILEIKDDETKRNETENINKSQQQRLDKKHQKDSNQEDLVDKTTYSPENKKKVSEAGEIGIENSRKAEEHTDDIISIEGACLDIGMSVEYLEDSCNTVDSSTCSNSNDAQIISIASSEDDKDENTSESWRDRYMKSKKVTSVLATARLSKRVRDKIKSSKRAEKSAKAKKEEAKPKETFISQHEDGSVEQYKELEAREESSKFSPSSEDQKCNEQN